ncbi:sigma 54-interacting transcriptional regulator [uncultured Desulfobacter sp.]|uniref:sigma-54-dependent Fis family transcriptional regulator n=1 Tax=uncultured Desulfobacter sp. TaxID=240139 RepID=UPI002AA74598|nr:sigma 54-interacting transcriptional regulator [uncultured Desulfobacter sp.]
MHPDYAPEYESLKVLLLEMANEHAVASLLKLIVRQLAQRPHVALARIWLVREGGCPCPNKEQICDGNEKCLHLMASQGSSLVDRDADWSRLDGDFSRFPLGHRKVGWIAANGKAVEVQDVGKESGWIARPDWARKEEILGFGGQPLVYKNEVLGVLAVFTRIQLTHEELVWMRMIANHAAASIVNAQAFEKIQRLQEQLALECSYLHDEVKEARAFGDIVGESDAMKNVMEQVDLVAPTDASVLILGESGTGKELVAREIHKRSLRSEYPLIKVNCASISRELYESEFFGHVKGAFSGAIKDRAGRFEAANGGTLFLDEVGEIPLDLQSKLLRVLQEGQYERVGEEITRQVDVRIIAATNQNLKKAAEKGRFRQDLYYRLNVFPIEVPPLKVRKVDIPLLAEHFLGLIKKRSNRKLPRLSAPNFRQLQNYDWPGNVRELQNVIERAVILIQGNSYHFELKEEKKNTGDSGKETIVPDAWSDAYEVLPESEMKRRERQNIIAALEKSDWKIYGSRGAADLLGLKPTTLAARMKKMNIKK